MTEIEQDIKLEPKEEIEEKETKLAEATRTMTTSRRAGKRGRKPAKIDVKAKLERSRQSARECRARKKLRYQYLEELVSSREKAIFSLRRELEACKKWTQRLDSGTIPPGLLDVLHQEHKAGLHQPHQLTRTTNWCQIVTDDDDEETDDEQVEVVELGEPAVQSKPRKRTTSERKTSESSVKSGRSRKRQASESSVTSHGLRTQTILKMFAGAKSDHSEASPGVNHSFSSTSSPYAIDTPSFDTVNTSLDVSGVSESAQNSGQFSTIDTSALNLGEAVAGTSSSVENDENSGLGSSLIDILSETQMKSLLESIEKGVWQ